jgi:hypothetical protein
MRAAFLRGMPGLRAHPEAGLMAAGEDDTAPVRSEDAGGALQAHWYDWGLALDSRSLLRGRQAAPPWMRAELVRLQAAFPEFSFGICQGWRGPMFETWRETGTGDLYAVITQDARELWRELKASQAEHRTAADTAGQEPQ